MATVDIYKTIVNRHTEKNKMKDEKRTQETVTKEDSRVTQRQGKRLSCALDHVRVCMAD